MIILLPPFLPHWDLTPDSGHINAGQLFHKQRQPSLPGSTPYTSTQTLPRPALPVYRPLIGLQVTLSGVRACGNCSSVLNERYALLWFERLQFPQPVLFKALATSEQY